MWGTLTPLMACQSNYRFIPTHVGNAPSDHHLYELGTVHPHACGERALLALVLTHYTGSSPRMWGTHRCKIFYVSLERFIPTHVGNAKHGMVELSEDPVHPHACGERKHRFISKASIYGSSPRMWGTLVYWCRYLSTRRFIPTHVGNA